VVLSAEQVDRLFREIEDNEGCELTVDLEAQQVYTPAGKSFPFEISPFYKKRLLQGLDDIGWTLQFASKIEEFENEYRREKPWMFVESRA
jgi:3-isopropylmalate/(R)-2-methylmalate dehydratase small subunit